MHGNRCAGASLAGDKAGRVGSSVVRERPCASRCPPADMVNRRTVRDKASDSLSAGSDSCIIQIFFKEGDDMLFAFILYFALMIGIGVYFMLHETGSGEKGYFLGGRQMGPWVTALSAQASDMSAWLLMGLPGSVMAFGFGQAWIGIGLTIGTILNWLLVAKRLRKFSSVANDSITIPQYLSNRFFSRSHALSIICAVVFLVSFTIYVASSFVAGASVFTTLVPTLSTEKAMLIFSVILILYTFMGGFSAVSWTDFFQGSLMLVAILAVPIVAVLTEKIDWLALNNVYEYKGSVYQFVPSFFNASAKDIVSGLGWGLGYFGMPHIIVRFMSIRHPSDIKKASVVAIIWVVIALAATIVIAVIGRAILGYELLQNGQQKMVFVALAKRYFSPFVCGILLSAIIAASMSTADSQLLVASSAFTSDIYRPIIKKNASDKEILWVGRLVVLAIAVVAYFIASSKGQGAQAIMNLVENAWGIFGASFGPVILLSLYWKRFTYRGAVMGIITGAVVDILWLVFMKSTGIYEIIPGFFCSLLASLVASLCDKEPSAEVKALFDKASDEDYDE